MSNIEKRPFVGTWKLNNRTVVKYTPDALIFVNGDTSLPGCSRCRGRVEVQKFVTGLSVEAGTDPMSHSATITLAIPRVTGQQVFIDGYNILRPGLEIHVFMRGYFPMRGMFSHLANTPSGPNAEAPPSDSSQFDMTKYATYPYYPVFHGLITQVSYEYSDGFYYGTLNCTSLLHFWQFVNITTAGAWMAMDKRPTDDKGRPTLYGHNFNNTHPFAIIYTLYRDVTGSAAGVDFALSEETDLDAPVEGHGNDGRQIFSMVSLYWTQRFKTRIQTLRMYGVNGQLYNGVQQAWLGTNRDVDGLLTSSTANDPTTTNSTVDPFAARISVAKSLGLTGAGADFTYSPLIQQDNEFFNLSVLDMFAFNQSIAELGPGNVWQSTYQTKMDIAQKVMEVTGYEFYQDVDGDLVFKPPFWNLDTAPNRYYRLEDSDILNITFTEKEPNATYIIVRGVWVGGFTDGTPTDDVLAKRGLYIDYKLVAQFGWRPAPTLELTYVLDPKVLFWIGVARLDRLNVDTFSATCTIPIRAELRPGFPVYIPFVDSYYYISQLSHSFAFGGQCTTSLVLTCRRSKWHAPGKLGPIPPTKSAIDQIRLDRPDLPPRPLEEFVNDLSKLVGFPNVVMALDPRKFNPNFSVVGIGIEYFDEVEAPGDLLFSWLIRDVHLMEAFQINTPTQGVDGLNVIEDPSQVTSLKLQTAPGKFITFTVDDLRRAFSDLQSTSAALKGAQRAVDFQKDVVAGADQQFNAFKLAQKAGQKTGANPSGRRVTETQRLDVLQGELQDELIRFRETTKASPSISSLVQIFDALQPNSNKPIRRKIDGIPGSDVKLSYFETLSHLKGQYMAGTVPGNYRYFSCSHPDPSQQGMPIIEWSDGERSKSTPGKSSPRKRGRKKSRKPRADGRARQPERAKALVAKIQEDTGIPGLDLYLEQWIESESLYYLDAAAPSGSAAGWFQQTSGRSKSVYPDGKSKYGGLNHQTIAFTPGTAAVIALRGSKGRLARSDFRALPTNQQTYMNLRIKAGGRLPGEGDVGRPSAAYVTSELVRFPSCTDVNPALRTTRTYKGAQVRYFRSMCRLGKSVDEAVAFGNTPITGDLRRAFFRNIPNQKPQERVDALAEKYMQFDGEFVKANAFLLPDKPVASVAVPEPTTEPTTEGTTAALPDTGDAAPVAATGTFTPGKPPRIDVREITLEVARTVVQFKPVVTAPGADRRAPEVILSTGKCKHGLQIALGPNRAPQVLTTDQIQRIHFIRHGAGKFTQIVGTSQNSGSAPVAVRGPALHRRITNYLMRVAGSKFSPEQTVKSVFQDVWDQISRDLHVPPFPVYEDGNLLGHTDIISLRFDDALQIEAGELDQTIVDQLTQQGIPSDTDIYFLGDFTLAQLALLPGYTKGGDVTAVDQTWQRPTKAAASGYANVIVRTIESGNNQADQNLEDLDLAEQEGVEAEGFRWVGQLALVKAASTSHPKKQDRLNALSKALSDALTKAFGADVVENTQTSSGVQETAVKEAINEIPIHSPVFPVSDEKGYEHYGAYRYGRGLSVEPGGTFEFIHSGKDPFRNVTAQSAEEFLRVLTLVKTGPIDEDTSVFAGIKQAALSFIEDLLSEKQDVLSTEGLSDSVAAQGGEAPTTAEATLSGDAVKRTGLSESDRLQVEASALALAAAVNGLGETARGRDVLRELLEANGDDPNILKGQTFDLSQTQFFRNYLNFAANFGKSPVFKTTASNAAYRLADLTAHLLNRAGQVCICRGSYADVTMEAYTRAAAGFVAGPGIDTETEKPEAFASEQAIQAQTPHTLQQQRERGSALQQPGDAGAFQDGRTVGAGQSGITPSATEQETVSGEIGATTTAVPQELGAGILPDLDPDEVSVIPDQIQEVPETGPLPLPELGDDIDEEEPLLPGINEDEV